MNPFLEQFLIECHEIVERATVDLLALEKHPADLARLDSVFRAFHTLKGSAGIVDFSAMARGLHAAEDVLSAFRSGADPVTPALIGDCLSALDQVHQWLDAMAESDDLPAGAEAEADAIVARFAAVSAGDDRTSDGWDAAWRDWRAAAVGARVAIRYRPDPRCFFQGQDPLALLAAVPGLTDLRLVPLADWPDPAAFDPFICGVGLLALSAAPVDAVAAALHSVIDQVELVELERAEPDLAVWRSILRAQTLMLEASEPRGRPGSLLSAGRVASHALRHAGRTDTGGIEEAVAAALAVGDPAPLIVAIRSALEGRLVAPVVTPEAPADGGADGVEDGPVPETVARTLRVDVDRIDALVRLTGELTVIKNAIGHVGGLAAAASDPRAVAAGVKDQHALLDRLVTELQHAVLRLRVLPMRQVFQRFPRLVRDLGLRLGKPIQLLTEGDDTEADKAIVESLFEPLLHVLRNAADHGLERAEDRRAAGKPATGTIWLRAVRFGDHVVVEIADDGGGVDLERVRQVAVQRGIADAAELAAMDDAEVVGLIFAPGFSTARGVTGVSGRGVGMDAVRAAVERLGGRVGVESRMGQGTTVRFTLAMTLMITRVMTVEAGGQVFGIPLDSVMETTRIDRTRIVPVGSAMAFTLRNRVVPLVDLTAALGLAASRRAAEDSTVVVASIGGDLTGLRVDRMGQRMDVMLKPMEGLLSGTPGIAGTTLLGDGRVLIVLDLPALLS